MKGFCYGSRELGSHVLRSVFLQPSDLVMSSSILYADEDEAITVYFGSSPCDESLLLLVSCLSLHIHSTADPKNPNLHFSIPVSRKSCMEGCALRTLHLSRSGMVSI